jgi:squalene synthase HpnC
VALTAQAAGLVPSLADAYAFCAALAQSHYENFSVASRLLPQELRRDLYVIYAFCRHTDDLGDEATGDRLALLTDWERELVHIYGGQPTHPIMVALQDVVRRFEIPDEPFRKLIQANRMDQGRVRFEAHDDLVRYCEHSAVPVGQMVLYLLTDRSAESKILSGATCTALQLANFWQDVARDFAMDRVYLPHEDMIRFGVAESDLARTAASPALKNLLRFEVGRTQELFEKGLPLVDRVHGRMKLGIALFSKGGLRVLSSIRDCDYDVLEKRPTVPALRKIWLTLSTAARLAILKRP